ncbi:cytochrome P450 [Podospora australis]|uniref:Cytochrome P450 n=1 Tax=Podospora australis TaxID=1536484 RepID=A0AAN6WZ02_9PEZI|nr:cytochrome P450 [Podospora australis]
MSLPHSFTSTELSHLRLTYLNSQNLLLSVASFVLITVAYFVISDLISPIRNYGGPTLAKYTNLWRLYHVTRGSFHKVLEDVHRKYGPVVRVGPNILDVDLPEMHKTVFRTKGDWRKTELYLASSSLVNGKIMYNVFSQLDPDIHAKWKKPIAKYYSMPGVAPMESHMDRTISLLCDQLESRFMGKEAAAGQQIDLGEWILFSMDYFAWVGTIPWLDRVLDKNPLVHIGPPSYGPITARAIKFVMDRVQGLDKEFHDSASPDYLDHFLEAKENYPETVDDVMVISYLMINMIAGADTTASHIRAALYYSLKTPRVWKRLRQELDKAGLTDKGRERPLSFKEVRGIAYLEAIVRESIRFFPALALSLERYVPPGGCQLPTGEFVAGGTKMGFNPYVICRNKDAYGEDSDVFRPERWLRDTEGGETEEGFKERLRAMNDADLTFGAGSRRCLGQHMALMQVYKVVATLAARYEIELVDKEGEWKAANSWFVRFEGFIVRMRKRE